MGRTVHLFIPNTGPPAVYGQIAKQSPSWSDHIERDTRSYCRKLPIVWTGRERLMTLPYSERKPQGLELERSSHCSERVYDEAERPSLNSSIQTHLVPFPEVWATFSVIGNGTDRRLRRSVPFTAGHQQDLSSLT